jgi:alpha-galactosidase
MPGIALIGAGSVAFARRLLADLLCMEGVTPSRIALMDVDQERLALMGQLAERLVSQQGLDTRVLVTTDTREAVDGADYVIMSIRVGGWEPRPHDIGIPLKYGIDQSVGDTIGPGGIFQGLRNAPALLAVADHMRQVCPKALIIQHSNPMAINCWLMSVARPDIAHVGLCHSVQGTSSQLAQYMDMPPEELDYWVAGINHMSWFLRLERAGQDLYPLLRERMHDPEVCGKDPVRFEILRQLGYFVTESSHHMSEYVPYFRRSRELMDEFGLKPRDMKTMSSRWQEYAGRLQEELDSPGPLRTQRTHEYTVDIIEAMETDRPCRVNVSVPNTALITNLPEGCAVEVPCVVDRLGVHPCFVGDLPPECAALNERNIRSQELAVIGALRGDREAVRRAIMLDPLTSAVLPLARIREMVDEMFETQQQWLPQFAQGRA